MIQISSSPIAVSSSIPNTSIKYQSESMIHIPISVTIHTQLVETNHTQLTYIFPIIQSIS